jgi:lipid-A-disaccharide synthase-like uncharacterized protein
VDGSASIFKASLFFWFSFLSHWYLTPAIGEVVLPALFWIVDILERAGMMIFLMLRAESLRCLKEQFLSSGAFTHICSSLMILVTQLDASKSRIVAASFLSLDVCSSLSTATAPAL